MDDRSNSGAVDSYLASINSSSIKNDEGFIDLYVNGVASKAEEYIETTKAAIDSNIVAEYESTKIIKCRRYKLYKTGK